MQTFNPGANFGTRFNVSKSEKWSTLQQAMEVTKDNLLEKDMTFENFELIEGELEGLAAQIQVVLFIRAVKTSGWAGLYRSLLHAMRKHSGDSSIEPVLMSLERVGGDETPPPSPHASPCSTPPTSPRRRFRRITTPGKLVPGVIMGLGVAAVLAITGGGRSPQSAAAKRPTRSAPKKTERTKPSSTRAPNGPLILSRRLLGQ